MRLVAFLLAIVASGCAIQAREPITSNPRMQRVQLAGETIMVAPYSDGTWGATNYVSGPWAMPNPAIERPKLSRAVEMATGCKVTDADYNPHSGNLVAAVDCKR